MKKSILIFIVLSTVLAACAPATKPTLSQKIEEQSLLVSPEKMSIKISETFQNILVTYNNPGSAVQKAVEPTITGCRNAAGSSVNFIKLSSKPRDVYGEQSEVYQLTVSSTKDAKYGTYSCTMGISINGQLQSSPTAPFTVEIRQ